jgi:hypothetical protein
MSDTELIISVVVFVVVFIGKCYAISKLGE